jgi:phosphohistidine phosphatase
VRHAIAAERGDKWPDDTQRPLTKAGIERFAQAVKGLKALDVALDEVLTSPLVRARQTAEILAAGLKRPPPIKTLDALAPGRTSAAVVAAVGKAARRPRVALVGHEPDLGELAAYLIGAGKALPFRKGGVCRIDLVEDSVTPQWTLVWFMPPRVLRELGT